MSQRWVSFVNRSVLDILALGMHSRRIPRQAAGADTRIQPAYISLSQMTVQGREEVAEMQAEGTRARSGCVGG